MTDDALVDGSNTAVVDHLRSMVDDAGVRVDVERSAGGADWFSHSHFSILVLVNKS